MAVPLPILLVGVSTAVVILLFLVVLWIRSRKGAVLPRPRSLAGGQQDAQSLPYHRIDSAGVSGTHQKRPGQLILDATAQQKLVLGTQVDQPAAIAMPSPMPSPTTMLLNSYAAASSYPNGTASLLLTARHVAQHDESAERSSLVPWDDWEGGGRGLSIAKDLQTPSSVFGARSGAYEGGHSSLIIATELHGSVLVTVAKNGELRVWDLEAQQCKYTLQLDGMSRDDGYDDDDDDDDDDDERHVELRLASTTTRLVAAVVDHNAVVCWDWSSQEVQQCSIPAQSWTCIGMSRHGHVIALGNMENQIFLWCWNDEQPTDAKLLKRIVNTQPMAGTRIVGVDCTVIETVGADGDLWFCSAWSNGMVRVHRADGACVSELSTSGVLCGEETMLCGRWLCSVLGSRLTLWDLKTGVVAEDRRLPDGFSRSGVGWRLLPQLGMIALSDGAKISLHSLAPKTATHRQDAALLRCKYPEGARGWTCANGILAWHDVDNCIHVLRI